MKLKYFSISFLLIGFARQFSCWQFYTSLVDYTLTNSYSETRTVHSEYYFGQCKKDENRKLYAHVFMDHIDVVGKTIIRGWLDIHRIPTCIVLRATSWQEDAFRSTSYNFQICVPRISYCHTHKRFKYYYYEWYIPADVIGGMNWDLYFYGPKSYTW